MRNLLLSLVLVFGFAFESSAVSASDVSCSVEPYKSTGEMVFVVLAGVAMAVSSAAWAVAYDDSVFWYTAGLGAALTVGAGLDYRERKAYNKLCAARLSSGFEFTPTANGGRVVFRW